MVVSCCSMKEAIREALRLIPNEPAVKDKQMIFLIIFLHSFPARDSHFARASHASRFNWKAQKKLRLSCMLVELIHTKGFAPKCCSERILQKQIICPWEPNFYSTNRFHIYNRLIQLEGLKMPPRVYLWWKMTLGNAPEVNPFVCIIICFTLKAREQTTVIPSSRFENSYKRVIKQFQN